MTAKVERIVRVLDYVLGKNHSGAPLSEIATSVAGPLSSTHDLLRSMVEAGLLQIDSRKYYRTGPTFVRLAISAMEQVDVIAAARPHLKGLVQSIGHDAYLAVRVGNTVVYVERVPGLRRAGLDIRLGDPVPLHSSAVGKLFAALSSDLEAIALASDLEPFTPRTITSKTQLHQELVAIRERNFSMSQEETITGIIGFAAPVFDPISNLVAAVHVSAFKDYLSNADIPRVTREAKECAKAIQDSLMTPQSSKEDS